jgi:hypothetical protein
VFSQKSIENAHKRQTFLLETVVRTFLFGIFLALSNPASAETNYTFDVSSCPQEICGSGSTIYIDGDIRPNEGEILENEIVKRGITRYSTIYLNSLGGSLYGGIELGRVIKRYGLSTSVGKPPNTEDAYGASGVCYSACTLAFLGGKFRYLTDDSLFGVHRFYSAEPSPDAEATAQIASAHIISYLTEVEIESNFFVQMTRASSDTIRIISKDQLVEMGVVNNGLGPTSWSIQATEPSEGTSTLYVRGERDTSFGINKAIFLCGPSGRNISMYVIFDPQGRAQEVLSMSAFSLMLDNRQFRLNDRLVNDIIVRNGWINATFELSSEHWSVLRDSQTIGVMFQFSFDAPMFMGFERMSLENATNFFAGIETACPAAYATTSQVPQIDQSLNFFQRFSDQDLFGDDLTSQGIRDVTLNECEAICTDAQQCLAYSYVEDSNWCFPKFGIGRPATVTGVTSGIKQ